MPHKNSNKTTLCLGLMNRNSSGRRRKIIMRETMNEKRVKPIACGILFIFYSFICIFHGSKASKLHSFHISFNDSQFLLHYQAFKRDVWMHSTFVRRTWPLSIPFAACSSQSCLQWHSIAYVNCQQITMSNSMIMRQFFFVFFSATLRANRYW